MLLGSKPQKALACREAGKQETVQKKDEQGNQKGMLIVSMKQKAYIVRDREYYSPCSVVVFAESSNKAKALALHTDCFQDFAYTELRTRREPRLDKYYRGVSEMDWDHSEDRIALVKECGFVCAEDGMEWEDCEDCPAKEWCDSYQERGMDDDRDS